jgi:hypothetical protein
VLLFLSVPTFGLWPLMWVALVPQMFVALDASTTSAPSCTAG